MAWVRIEENAIYNTKVMALSPLAFRLWVEALSYCQRELTNGYISTNALKAFRYQNRQRVEELTTPVEAGRNPLWIPTSDGFRLNDYLMYNEERERVLEARAAARDRLRKWREKRDRNGVSNTAQNATHVPSRHDTSHLEDPGESSAPPSAPSEPAWLIYPTQGKGKTWPLVASQVAKWEALYPGLDVRAECRKALAWCEANTKRRKTPDGMSQFLVNWLNTATNRGGIQKLTAPAQQQARDYGADHVCPHTPECNGRFACVQRQQAEAAREAV